jgi:hypothetical protein
MPGNDPVKKVKTLSREKSHAFREKTRAKY